jgi:N-methylhydantoinase A
MVADKSVSAVQAIIGIDTGGTFTDVTLLDIKTGHVWNSKTPSTPDDPSQGFGNGITEVLNTASLTGADVSRVLHGTTVATNLILEGKGARAALLTTSGFKYVLEIGRQDVPRRSNLFTWVKPTRPVTPRNIYEIDGRVTHTGDEITPLDENAVRLAARQIAEDDIDAVAIVFLHSYANAAHEQRAAAIIQEECPDLPASISSDVLPVFREFERSMTTILNVHVMPVVTRYVERLDLRLTERGIGAPLLLMKSSGGVTSTRNVRRAPVETALSGPAAGAVGAAFIGQSAGIGNLLGIDIGGTSADICLIQDGDPGLTTQGRIGEWPVGLPMVDIVTIGAGGGSIARISEGGTLGVGPQSAGAQPGPVCYGRGGTEPTVTDAHIVLGHLPAFLLGGRLQLDIDGARQAVKARIADPLGMTIESAARGILAIVDSHMVGAMRVVSVERGQDPGDFTLLPFGGAGPLHGGALAGLLDMSTILVPPSPGVLSALGLLVSSLKAEFARTCLQLGGNIDMAEIASMYRTLHDGAVAWLDEENVLASTRQITWSASFRYENQGFELFIPWPAGRVDQAAVDTVMDAFHSQHERLYTFAQHDTPVEIVTLRVDARGIFPAPVLTELVPHAQGTDVIVGRQAVHFEGGTMDCPIVDRNQLGADAVIEGPAILTQLDSTTLVLPGQTGRVDRYGNLLLTRH